MTETAAYAGDSSEVRDTETAKKYFDQGWQAEMSGDRMAAISSYEAAYTADPQDANVCFRLAYNLDLLGEEDEALHLYEEAVRQERPSLQALINLAVLYEDRSHFARAERCIRQVLNTEPNHPRARLFIKDIMASKGMLIDDEQEKRLEKHNAMLDTPVTDFELSVRTRNALRKMSIRTLGDLLRVTEPELRSFKNFGDASLEEIKTMLAQKGLKLGQAVEQHQESVKEQVYEQLREQGGNDEMLSKSVNELNLSVRARKALALLNVQTIGDLAMKTEAELMGVKNFGMTSLVEIKEKLTENGLGLRSLDA
ncbi:DNA-directed RNA polymerase subunit alpha C-terminal domain-containing protein [Mucisphaera calidilacus]|uniref:DNA-directed RNA polymerase subunit alpha n=1 Tax=Mucisphaera calidilacus TaxID=2527982 RepID=A0A518BVB7_9BACT|nr:DNA-directed RNA polymerase subunit alpha C-terminal domain-containing protein [Mucisphaera calidilacus]QDU70933.1 DNA-directed RNA polymerase subunit alpha [Mucisphaera calidilacus]